MTDRELLELAAGATRVRKRHGMNKSPEHRAAAEIQRAKEAT